MNTENKVELQPVHTNVIVNDSEINDEIKAVINEHETSYNGDNEEKNYTQSKSCSLIVNSDNELVIKLKKFWYLYTWPYVNLKPVTLCIIYNILSFWWTLGLWIYVGVTVPITLSLTSLFCIGIPLFYISTEIFVLLMEMDLRLTYFLLDFRTDSNITKPQIAFRYGILPALCDCPNRMKSVLLDFQTYKMYLYVLFFKPIVSFACGIISFLLMLNLSGFVGWIIYLIHSSWFTGGYICLFGQNNENCYGWAINDFGDAILLLFLCMVTYPLFMYANLACGSLSRMLTYYFITNVYDSSTNREERTFLNPTHDVV